MALSKEQKAATLADPTGTAQALNAFGSNGYFGSGKTSKQQSGLYTGSNADDTINGILQRIQGKAGVGTFNEGQMSQAIEETKNLQQQLQAGKISQGDYARITDAYLPQIIQYGNQMMGVNSAGANAARPWVQQLNDLSKDTQIYKAGQQYLGRDLTPSELAEIKPKFADGTDIGNAYVASLADQEKNSPDALGKKAGQYSGDVNGIFQDLLKRGATPDEVDYFGRALASGQTTAYQMKQYVQSLPEYQNQQDTQFRQGLQTELGNYDKTAFDQEKNNILSSYTKAGIQNSSALDFAMTDALSKMQTNRDQYLSGISAQQYGGNKAAALNDYQQSQNQYLGNLDYQRNQSQSNLNYLTQRADQGSDYNRQMSDYLNYLQNQPKQSGGGVNPLQGGLTGAAAGSPFGPYGALIGGGVGLGLSYLNR